MGEKLVRSLIYESFHIYIFINSFRFHGRIEPTNLLAPKVDGFISKLVEHRTGNANVIGSNPAEARFFFGLILLLLQLLHNCEGHMFHSVSTCVRLKVW